MNASSHDHFVILDGGPGSLVGDSTGIVSDFQQDVARKSPVDAPTVANSVVWHRSGHVESNELNAVVSTQSTGSPSSHQKKNVVIIIMKVSVLLTLAVVAIALCSLATRVESGSSVMNMRRFEDWMRTHNKVYATEAEKNLRFKNFEASLARIARLNSERLSEEDAVFDLNKFSDLSPEEFKNLYRLRNGLTVSEKKENVLAPSVEPEDLPSYVDWEEKGAVTPVKNQEQCGSCWAFSTTEAIESANILTGKFTADDIDLAPQQIVDCDTTDDGCGGGNPPTAYAYVIGAGGLESNSSYPYTAENGPCKFRKSEVVASISNWAYATTEFKGESLLQQNLVSWGPLSVCVDAARWQDYASGVMSRIQCDIIPILDHCVQLVGFNMTAPVPYYRVRNSWGVDWGLAGYILLEVGNDPCGITHEASWPTV
eukprot:TRINITY_DN28_c0_g1_i3.p1 TRINITY_DN28_c0_g1~~TRINITY_DN28_c0_g1_i3.p1  ORF type:complete len:427 (-),score=88.07 TRINITY_DN28_c0_g1_i3:105-1385(-)